MQAPSTQYQSQYRDQKYVCVTYTYHASIVSRMISSWEPQESRSIIHKALNKNNLLYHKDTVCRRLHDLFPINAATMQYQSQIIQQHNFSVPYRYSL